MKAKNYDQKRKDLKKLKKEVMEQGFEDSRHRKSFKQDIKRSFRSLKRSEKQTIAKEIEKEIEQAPQLNWIEHLTTDQEVQGSNPYGVTIGGSSSVGRASASQALGRGFEPRFPLKFFIMEQEEKYILIEAEEVEKLLKEWEDLPWYKKLIIRIKYLMF